MRISHLTLNPHIYVSRPTLNVSPGQILFDVFSRTDGTFVGGLSLLQEENDDNDVWELGYWILPEWAGSGLVKEAALSLIDELFVHHHTSKIVIHCDSRNQSSIKVAKSLGANPEAIWSGIDRNTGETIKRLVFVLYKDDSELL